MGRMLRGGGERRGLGASDPGADVGEVSFSVEDIRVLCSVEVVDWGFGCASGGRILSD